MQAVVRDLWPGQQRAKGMISSNAQSCTLRVTPALLNKLNNCQELTMGSFQTRRMSDLQTQWAFPPRPKTDNTARIQWSDESVANTNFPSLVD